MISDIDISKLVELRTETLQAMNGNITKEQRGRLDLTVRVIEYELQHYKKYPYSALLDLARVEV